MRAMEAQGGADPGVGRGTGRTNAHIKPLVINFSHAIFGNGWLLKERFMLDNRGGKAILNLYDLVLCGNIQEKKKNEAFITLFLG